MEREEWRVGGFIESEKRDKAVDFIVCQFSVLLKRSIFLHQITSQQKYNIE